MTANRLVTVTMCLATVGACGVEDGEATAERLARAVSTPAVTLHHLGTAAIGILGRPEGSAEISAYDPETRRLYTTNAAAARVDVIDLADPTAPVIVGALATDGVPNSVAVRSGVVAVAVEGTPRTAPGKVRFYRAATGRRIVDVTVGAVPDMLAFTPNGRYLLVANEGEPSGYGPGHVDPEGSVSIIDMSGDVRALSQAAVRTARFGADIPMVNRESIRVFGPGATFAQDMEPEYITVSHDSRTAWVTLQENNAVAVLDIEAGRFTRIAGLGFKDHSLSGNGLDASDRDGRINIASWPVLGTYQPDAIAAFQVQGRTYLATANEGDAREWPCAPAGVGSCPANGQYTDEIAVGDIPVGLLSAELAAYRSNDQLGRLRVSREFGRVDGIYQQLYAFGARSFSIWSADLEEQVFDSGDQLERITSELLPHVFNASHDANARDARSRSKGPEPEALAIAKFGERTFAFVGLERIGGVMVYEVTDPRNATFVSYTNRRGFTTINASGGDDLGPEGLFVIPAEESPNGRPLLVQSNEVSGTTSIFEIALGF